jgi:hypothetical protein
MMLAPMSFRVPLIEPFVVFICNGGSGAGGGSGTSGAGTGAGGAVRIIWGAGRSFPSTNTGDM